LSFASVSVENKSGYIDRLAFYGPQKLLSRPFVRNQEPIPLMSQPSLTQPTQEFSPWSAWLVLVVLCSLVIVSKASFKSARPSALSAYRFQVDINQAGLAELAALPEIGPKTAASIIEHRRINGPFETVDQLLQVPGIGATTLKQLQSSVQVGSGVEAAKRDQSVAVR
jgi:competence ComEA-like helix-hairpin-helix protein